MTSFPTNATGRHRRSIKILQANLQRRRVSHDVAFATAVEEGIDIIIASEPNRNLVKGGRWCVDKRGDVAVYFQTRDMDQNPGRRAAIQVDRKVDWDLFRTLLQWNIELQGKSVSEALAHTTLMVRKNGKSWANYFLL
nr:unnamed protein product [Callosobruchus chinensis]